MSIKVLIPQALTSVTGNERQIALSGKTVGEVIEQLCAKYEGMRERLFDEKYDMRKFVNVFVNEKNIKDAENLETKVKDDDEISIIYAVAGG